MCDALFFDARELRTHFAKSQACEFTGALPADVLSALVKTPESMSLEEEQIVSQHKKLHLKALVTKHTPFEASAYVRNNEMMNTMAFKRLQYTTRCYTLALMNTFTSNFKLYRNSNPQASHDDAPWLREDATVSGSGNSGANSGQPFICPECGLSFDPKTRDGHMRYRHHLIYECFFTLKHQVPELKCPIRGCSFSTDVEQQMVAHWSQAHLVKRIECNLCASQTGFRYAFDEVKNHVVLAKSGNAASSG